jgi:hypothetical protein
VALAARLEVIKLACRRPDKDKTPYRDVWTQQALANTLLAETGVLLSRSEVCRILNAEGLRPHLVRPPGAADIDQLVAEEGARGECRESCLLAVLVGEHADAIEQPLFRVEEGVPKLRGDAQQLVAVLVADARSHRHGDDAAEDAGPEGVDECGVVGEEQQHAIAGAGAAVLQRSQDTERTLVQLAVGDAALAVGVVVGDVARFGALPLEQLA